MVEDRLNRRIARNIRDASERSTKKKIDNIRNPRGSRYHGKAITPQVHSYRILTRCVPLGFAFNA